MSIGEILLGIPIWILGMALFLAFMSPAYVPGIAVVWLIRKKVFLKNRRLQFLVIAPIGALLLAPSFAAYGHIMLLIPIGFCIPLWWSLGWQGVDIFGWWLALPATLTFIGLLVVAIKSPNHTLHRTRKSSAPVS